MYHQDPEKYVTLQDIVEAEREAHGIQWPKVGATLALMWLKRWALTECHLCLVCSVDLLGGGLLMLVFSCRGLRFIQILLQSLADGEKDENNPNHIRVNIIKAYEQALKKYHGWFVQRIFKVRIIFPAMFFFHYCFFLVN